MSLIDQIGYRDVVAQPPNALNGRMMASPTGRQLAIDGNLAFTVNDSDPSLDPAFQPSEGIAVMWPDGSGNLWLSAYTRDTGWTTVELAPS